MSAIVHPHADARPPEEWAEQAAGRLADAGYRRGGARRAVIDLLAGQPCALSALEIEEALRATSRARQRPPRPRRARAAQARRRVGVGQGTSRYEPLRPHSHHHDLVCDDCGELIPFEDGRARAHERSRRATMSVP